MNPNNLKLAAGLIDANYVEIASESLKTRDNQIKSLLSHRTLPEEGFDELTIEHLLLDLAKMDTNNFSKKVGVGERESRIYSNLVQKRHFYMGHGIGRSGEVNAVQPKAPGSSLVLKLTKCMTFDALKVMGYDFVKELLLLPLATGMALSMALLAAASIKPKAKYVIWPRIDQKTCLKCISAANLVPIVIENVIENEEIRTNLPAIEAKIAELGAENILGILSTTSCFSPRVPDKVEELAVLAKKHDIFHIINNAYGLQCTKIAYSINQGSKHGRIDAVIQSTDKNFLVPVGGSIIFAPTDTKVVDKISSTYPGRASGAPITDLFITFLSMGRNGLKQLLKDRKDNIPYMKEKLTVLAKKHDEKVLSLPNNTISMAMTLKNLSEFLEKQGEAAVSVTELGSKLFLKRVMGTRVIAASKAKEVAGLKFKNYGSHIDEYPHFPYINAACVVGQTKEEIDVFVERLDKCYEELKKETVKAATKAKKATEEESKKGEPSASKEDKKPEKAEKAEKKAEIKPEEQMMKTSEGEKKGELITEIKETQHNTT